MSDDSIYLDHDRLNDLTVNLEIRGDVAVSVLNAFHYAFVRGNKAIDEVMFCGHSEDKVIEMLEGIKEQLGLE